MTAKAVHAALKIKPLRLRSKEGLGMINGTQFMSAYAVHCLHRIETLLATADVIAAMSLEAYRGGAPFDDRVRNRYDLGSGSGGARKHPHAADALRKSCPLPRTARRSGSLFTALRPAGHQASPTRHYTPRRWLKSRSIRRRTTRWSSRTATCRVENFRSRSRSRSCWIISRWPRRESPPSRSAGTLLLGGDTVGERKVPRLLVKEGGLNSGQMLCEYGHRAFVSENKILAHPASVDSIPSSLGQEDHVSMGSIGAASSAASWRMPRRCSLSNCWAPRRRRFIHPLHAGEPIEAAHRALRKQCAS